jgi:hypothetical protein
MAVRIVESETRALNGLHEVDLGVFEIKQAVMVHENIDPVLSDDLVALVGIFFEFHSILEAGAPAGHHREPDTVERLLLGSHE